MYYLFMTREKDLTAYKAEFDRVKASMLAGRTPVCNEMRLAKTNLVESFPYNALNGAFLIGGTLLLQHFDFSTMMSVGITMVVDSLCCAISNYVFTVLKHRLRIKLCGRLGIEPTEQNIGVMESLEYQTV